MSEIISDELVARCAQRMMRAAGISAPYPETAEVWKDLALECLKEALNV